MGTGYSTLKVIAAGVAVAAIASTAHAATTFNTSLVDPPGFYNGSGNPNTNFTVNETAGVELGLGIQYRYRRASNSAPANVYNVTTVPSVTARRMRIPDAHRGILNSRSISGHLPAMPVLTWARSLRRSPS